MDLPLVEASSFEFLEDDVRRDLVRVIRLRVDGTWGLCLGGIDFFVH